MTARNFQYTGFLPVMETTSQEAAEQTVSRLCRSAPFQANATDEFPPHTDLAVRTREVCGAGAAALSIDTHNLSRQLIAFASTWLAIRAAVIAVRTDLTRAALTDITDTIV